MPIIDEEGQLFGTVNVVDALVVLLFLVFGLAGTALVLDGSGGSLDETRYATLNLPDPNPDMWSNRYQQEIYRILPLVLEI